MGRAGVFAYIEYSKEATFNTAIAAGAGTRVFGLDQKVTTFRMNKNRVDLGDLNSALIQKYSYGLFEGGLGINWILSNPWFFDLILGNAVNAGVGPFTHTYDDSKTVNSATVEIGLNPETTNVVHRLSGAVLRSATISSSATDTPARVSGDFLFAQPQTPGTVLDTTIATDTYNFPFNYTGGVIEMPDGTVLAEVQSMEMTLAPNIRLIPGPNNQFNVGAYKGRLDITGKFTLAIKDATWFNNAIANRTNTAEELASMNLFYDNGLAGTSQRKIDIVGTGVGLGDYSLPLDQYELMVEDIPFVCRDVQVIATDNTSAPP